MDAATKLEAVEREIKYRRRVYGRWVAESRMSAPFAEQQIKVFEEIAEDYRTLAAKERLI